VEDDGTVNVASADADAVKKALDIIKGLTAEAEVGATYTGTVRRVTDFGAFVEILPNTDGLLHISEMAHTRVERVEDVMKEGDTVEVKVLSVDRDGKIRLSRRELLPLPDGEEGERARERMAMAREGGPPPRRDGPRGDRGDRPRGDGPPRGDRPPRERRDRR
jgi:polyribonucleotide nucleotidyltransferase